MSTIALFIYSFQNNDLINVVNDIISKSSGNNIIAISIIDQNSINHYKKFNIRQKNIYMNYQHKVWDAIDSPIKYKKHFLDSINTDYAMICSDGINLCDQWDMVLIDSINKKDFILSGNAIKSLELYNDMVYKTQSVYSDEYALSNNIDRSFIFGKTELFKKIDWPVQLKYYGEEEVLYMSCVKNNIQVYKVPTYIYKDSGKKLNEYDYVPFSLTHKYNTIIKQIDEYNIKDNIIFNNLKEIKYQNDDVEYDPFESDFNKIAGERYLNKTRSID